MRNAILALILISFLAFPAIELVLSAPTPAPAVPSLTPPPGGCRLLTKTPCETTYINFCWWDPTHVHEGVVGTCRDRAPKIGLIAGISRIIDIVFTILIAAAALFVMVGAFQFVTAGGDTEKVGAAREKILYAVIAVVVALLARGIITFIRGAFPAV